MSATHNHHYHLFISGTWPIERKNSTQTETHSESTKKT